MYTVLFILKIMLTMETFRRVIMYFLIFGYVSAIPETYYDTIVVGLGAAGTAAASKLAKAGKRVLALEAQDRIGGRVKTVQFGDGVVEEGAEWVHGSENNPVYDVAIANNIDMKVQDMTATVFKSDGSLGNSSLVNELVNFCLLIMRTKSEEPEAMGNYITRRLINYIEKKYPELLRDKDFVTEFMEMMQLIVNNNKGSNDWNDVDAFSPYEELRGSQDLSWNRYGYRTYFELLLNTYNNGPGIPKLDIKLNKEVVTITWPRDSVGKVQVLCKDGDAYTADNVIVTVSLGVLKERYSSLFLPSLPTEKIYVINNMAIGIIGKIILEFEKQWLPKNTSILFFWRGQDKKKVSREDHWITKIYAAVAPMGSTNTLTLWTSGVYAKMVETLPEDIVTVKIMQLLRKFVGNKIMIPEPTRMIRSTWHNNPFIRGSYTYDNVFMQEYPNARQILAAPLVDGLGVPRVLFAGEATDVKHYGNVHAATDSGYREAMRLL